MAAVSSFLQSEDTLATRSKPRLIAPEPEQCPGPESLGAGSNAACEGCPNQAICATAPKGPDPDIAVVKERLSQVSHKILILSGKGGVGKSTFTATLGRAFAENPLWNTGIMDADICGPSIPAMLGVEKESIHVANSGWSPVWISDNLSVMSIQFMLPNRDDAIIWRGPKKNGLIKQFLKDVDWADTDILLIDTPPGTSDEHLSVSAFLQEAGISGAIILSTPQEVSLLDVRKEIGFCRKAKIPVLGLVENMSGFVCPSCNHHSKIFKPTTGGTKQLASLCGVPFLGSIPLDPRLGMSCDLGQNFLQEFAGSAAQKSYYRIVSQISEALGLEKPAPQKIPNH